MRFLLVIGFLLTSIQAQAQTFRWDSTITGDKASGYGSNLSVSGNNSIGFGLDTTNRTITDANTMAIVGGNVGIGTVSPATELEIDGELKLGSSSSTCAAALEGTVRYNTSINALQLCDGTDWQRIAQATAAASLVISPTSYANMDTSGSGSPATGSYVTFTVENIGNSTSQNISTQLSNTVNFEFGTDNCDGNTLASSATCTVQVRPKSYIDTTYTGTINILADNQPSGAMSGEATGSCGSAGDSVGGGELVSCKSTYDLVVTPGGCTDSTTPTCAGGSDTVTKDWSDVEVDTGANSHDDGVINTNVLIGLSDNYYAAEYCANMTYGGYSDWYLPARDELQDDIYPVRSSLTGIVASRYTSSHEAWATYYSAINLAAGTVHIDDKIGEAGFIRCARRN